MSSNADIDINDPNFWEKWAKKANIEEKNPEDALILYEPRSRKRRFREEHYKMEDGSNSDTDGMSIDTLVQR